GASFIRQRRRVGLDGLTKHHEFVGVAEPLQQLAGKRARASFVGAMEQIEANGRIGPIKRLRQASPNRFHRPPEWRTNRARRETIWSAITWASRSCAVCSAATVAYSELTMSIPASDPAVASNTTSPVFKSTSR